LAMIAGQDNRTKNCLKTRPSPMIHTCLWFAWCMHSDEDHQFLATHFLRQRGQSSDEPYSVHFKMQCKWKWCRHWPWIGTQSSPGTLHRGQGDSNANWQIVQHSSVSMSHFQVATAFQEFILTFII
jgi:hypothetical protein